MYPKVFLDTTYLLPLFGVDIGLSKSEEETLQRIIDKLLPAINSLSLLEVKWKILHFSKKNKQLLSRFSKVLKFITLTNKFQIVPFYESVVDELATELYKIHKDYIDCSILAAAITTADVLLTEDSIISNLEKTLKEQKYLFLKEKETFEVMPISEFKA